MLVKLIRNRNEFNLWTTRSKTCREAELHGTPRKYPCLVVAHREVRLTTKDQVHFQFIYLSHVQELLKQHEQ